MKLAKKAQLNPKKVRLCICHEAQWVSSKAGCSALAFSGGYRGKGRVGRGEQREVANWSPPQCEQTTRKHPAPRTASPVPSQLKLSLRDCQL